MDLINAAESGNIERVRELLDSGEDPNLRDRYNMIALISASRGIWRSPRRRRRQIEIVELLLDRGADPNLQNDYDTALMEASERDHVEIVKLLLDRGADPNLQNDWGNTALIRAAANGHTEIVRLLLDRGADPNIQDDDDYTALMIASENGHTEIVRLLLDRGADPNLQNDYNNTALMNASEFGRTEIVKLLLDRGADPNLQNREDYTALIRASDNGHTEIVRLLLDHGANPNIINNRGNTALMIAERLGQDDVARLIRDHIHLQKARQDLALVSFFNPRLGMDSPLNYLDESNIIGKIMSEHRRYDPSINIRMIDERRRDKLTKARQRLASMRGLSHRDSVFKYLREPQLMENISEHLSKMRPVPSVQTRLMLEDRQEEPDEDYLRTLNPEKREQFLQERETVRKGGSKRSSRKSSRKNKNYTRTRFFR